MDSTTGGLGITPGEMSSLPSYHLIAGPLSSVYMVCPQLGSVRYSSCANMCFFVCSIPFSYNFDEFSHAGIYYMTFPKDLVLHKAVVYGIFILDTVQLFMFTAWVFDNIVNKWETPLAYASPGTIWFTVPILTGLISAAVQMMFAWHLWILTGIVVVLAFLQLTSAIVASAQMASIDTFAEINKTTTADTVWLITSAFVDMFIAASMTAVLLKSRNHLVQNYTLIN